MLTLPDCHSPSWPCSGAGSACSREGGGTHEPRVSLLLCGCHPRSLRTRMCRATAWASQPCPGEEAPAGGLGSTGKGESLTHVGFSSGSPNKDSPSPPLHWAELGPRCWEQLLLVETRGMMRERERLGERETWAVTAKGGLHAQNVHNDLYASCKSRPRSFSFRGNTSAVTSCPAGGLVYFSLSGLPTPSRREGPESRADSLGRGEERRD